MGKKSKGRSKNKTDSAKHEEKPQTETKNSEKESEIKSEGSTAALHTSTSDDDAHEVSTSKKPEEREWRSYGNKNRDYSPYRSDRRPNSRWSDQPQRQREERYDSKRDSDRRRSNNSENAADRRPQNYSRRSDSFRDRKYNDPEFEEYEAEFRSTDGQITYVRTNEIEYDLFQMPKEYSLGHCVAEDMNMGSGIAVQFRYKFKKVDELLNQRQRKGGLAILEDGDRWIYYLVTKQFSTGKPTYWTLFSSLQKMRKHVIENKVTKLAMPRIGCGLDRLEWDRVKYMIEFVFKDVDVEITICNLAQTEDSPQSRHRNCALTNVTYPIEDIEKGTVIVYLSTEDGHISEEMTKLDKKFDFLREFRIAARRTGSVIYYKKNRDYLLCGCIVRRKLTDPIDFGSFQRCLYDVQKTIKNLEFYYVGFQAFKDRDDDTVNWKIINILRNAMRGVDIYVCWTGDLQNELLAKERSGGDYRSGQNKRDDDSNWRKSDSEAGRSGRRLEFVNPPQTSNIDAHVKVESDEQMSCSDNDRSFNEDTKRTSEDEINDCWFKNDKAITPQKHKSGNPPSSINIKTQTAPDHWDNDIGDVRSPSKKPKINDLNNDNLNKKVSGIYSDNLDKIQKVSISQSDDTKEFEMYQKQKRGSFKGLSSVKELDQSSLPKTYSSACYVTQVMDVESGVPYGLNIKDYLGQLLNQSKKQGDVAFVKHKQDFLYCLVVKRTTNSAPIPKMVFTSIQKMRDHAIDQHIKTLVIPKMDESWDFQWREVNSMLEFLFRKKKTEIIITHFPIPQIYHDKVKLDHSKSGLHQMKKKSIILYWASKDKFISEEMKSLERTFKICAEFENGTLVKGHTIRHERSDDYVIYGCVIREKSNDPIDFDALQSCISEVNEYKKIKPFSLLGIQALNDDDESTNYKIFTVLKAGLQDVTIKVCWPGPLKDKMPSK